MAAGVDKTRRTTGHHQRDPRDCCVAIVSCRGQGEDCKRQLAILFSFLEEGQPSEQIEGLLGEVDNGGVSSLVITDPGGGYTGAVPKVLAVLCATPHNTWSRVQARTAR